MYNIDTDSHFIPKADLPEFVVPEIIPTKPEKIAQPAEEDDEELRGFLDGTLKYDPLTDSLFKDT